MARSISAAQRLDNSTPNKHRSDGGTGSDSTGPGNEPVAPVPMAMPLTSTPISSHSTHDRPLGVVVHDIAIEPGGYGFDSRTCHIRLGVDNGSPPLRRFSVVQALSRDDGPHHSLHASA